MKIALISPYDFAYSGGVTEHVIHLARGLRHRGHDAWVLAPCSKSDVAGAHPELVKFGRPLPIPTHGSLARITVGIHLTNRIKNHVRGAGYDIVHLHEPLMPVLPLTALRFSTSFNVGTFHAFAESNVGYYYGKPILKRYVRRLETRIAVSTAAQNFVQRYFPGEYRVIPNGIDTRSLGEALPFPELRDGRCNILFVGRLEYRKGLGYLLRAFKELATTYDKLRLIVVGGGPLFARYKRFVERNQLENVLMTGHVTASDKVRYYASADIFCAPNTGNESFGLILLEAMAAGKPVVASDIDGFRDVIEKGREGLLFEAKNEIKLISAMQTVIDDVRLRTEMGHAGAKTAALYDWDLVIEQLLQVYAQTTS